MSELAEIFNGGSVVDKSGNVVDLKTHCAGKIVGIYFSAHWCPPCRGFTPLLTKFYSINSQKKNFEVIFVSSDNDEKSFSEYYHSMPWLALEYKQRDLKQQLSNKYQIDGIPTLVMIDADSGKVHSNDAVADVAEDEKGDGFPWSNL